MSTLLCQRMTSRNGTDVKPVRFSTGSSRVLPTDSQAGEGCHHQYSYCHGRVVPSPWAHALPLRATPEYALPVRRWVLVQIWVSLETYSVCEQHIPLTAGLSAWTHAHVTPFPLKECYHRNFILHLIWCNCRFLSESAVCISSSSLSSPGSCPLVCVKFGNRADRREKAGLGIL